MYKKKENIQKMMKGDKYYIYISVCMYTME